MSIVVNDQTSQCNPKNQKCHSNAKYIITIAIIVPIIILFVLLSFYIYCLGAQLFQWNKIHPIISILVICYFAGFF